MNGASDKEQVVRIAEAALRDAGQILELQYLCYQTVAELYDDYAIPPLTQNLASLLTEYETHRILAAKLGDEVIGSVRGRLTGDTCIIGRLIVHPRLQRRGAGVRLMRDIKSRFSDAARYELFTGHLSEGNLRLYGRLGYTEFRRGGVSPRLCLVYLEKPGVRCEL